nr:uncharacterized mitochondrial protein AtMg00810-like [Tanacetum cinerariifolium]
MASGGNDRDAEYTLSKLLQMEVVGGGEALGIGEDGDLCNAATDEDDDAVESRDISILNSLIGHGSPCSLQLCGTIGTTDVQVLINKDANKEVQFDVYTLHVIFRCNAKKDYGIPKSRIFFRHHLEVKVVVKEWGMICPCKQYLDHLYALDKALYGLKQASHAWYDVLSQFLIDNDFQKGSIDTTLFIKKNVVKKIFRYLKGTINLGLLYPKDSGFDLTAYSDADHAGCHLDRKSTSGSVQFLGDKLVCWSSKKQNYVSISTAESEYVTVSSCCAQVLWMRTQLTDYGFFYDKVPIYCDSDSAISISCNLV